MHIYTNEVTDWVIAISEEDANAVLCEQYGYTIEQLKDDEMQITAQWPDDKPLSVTDEEDGKQTRLLPAEWIAREGRGLLCSTEF